MRLMAKRLKRLPGALLCGGLFAWTVIVLSEFPWATDGPIDRAEEQATFYAAAYSVPKTITESERILDERHVAVANRAAEAADVGGMVRVFGEKYDLTHKRFLDVGSGRGYPSGRCSRLYGT